MDKVFTFYNSVWIHSNCIVLNNQSVSLFQSHTHIYIHRERQRKKEMFAVQLIYSDIYWPGIWQTNKQTGKNWCHTYLHAYTLVVWQEWIVPYKICNNMRLTQSRQCRGVLSRRAVPSSLSLSQCNIHCLAVRLFIEENDNPFSAST